MGKAENRKKSSAMASYLKDHHVIRNTIVCPHCHRVAGTLNSFFNHLQGHVRAA